MISVLYILHHLILAMILLGASIPDFILQARKLNLVK